MCGRPAQPRGRAAPLESQTAVDPGQQGYHPCALPPRPRLPHQATDCFPSSRRGQACKRSVRVLWGSLAGPLLQQQWASCYTLQPAQTSTVLCRVLCWVLRLAVQITGGSDPYVVATLGDSSATTEVGRSSAGDPVMPKLQLTCSRTPAPRPPSSEELTAGVRDQQLALRFCEAVWSALHLLCGLPPSILACGPAGGVG